VKDIKSVTTRIGSLEEEGYIVVYLALLAGSTCAAVPNDEPDLHGLMTTLK